MPSPVRRIPPPLTDLLSGAPQRRPGTRTTEVERVMMRQLFHVTGISRTTIARALGVSYSTVWTYTRPDDRVRDALTPGDQCTP